MLKGVNHLKFIYGNELEQEIKNNPEGSIRIDKCDNTYIIQNDLEYGGENQELRIEEYGWEVPFVEWLKKGNIFGELGEERGCHCGGIYFKENEPEDKLINSYMDDVKAGIVGTHTELLSVINVLENGSYILFETPEYYTFDVTVVFEVTESALSKAEAVEKVKKEYKAKGYKDVAVQERQV